MKKKKKYCHPSWKWWFCFDTAFLRNFIYLYPLQIIRSDYLLQLNIFLSPPSSFRPPILYAQLIELFWEFGINNGNHSTLLYMSFVVCSFFFFCIHHHQCERQMHSIANVTFDVSCKRVFLLAIKTFYSYWNIEHNINFNLLTVILWNFK